MKILEMRPRSYDQRMEKISRGRVRAVKEAAAGEVLKGSHVLEIGCGTGELASLIVERGCIVEGFDLSPLMVKTAEKRIEKDDLTGKFSITHMGVDGMDGFPGENFDAVVSTLVLSELNDDERRFALKHAARVLRPGGCIIIADEVVPRTALRRLVHNIARLPLLAITYLVSGKSTYPIDDLAREISEVGFVVGKEVRSHGDSFTMVVGFKKQKQDKS
jgi:demethylmenaquinone methyltransferase/2-methoxy-6-polyprenyl-1,4-benzoquinol methylase